MRGAQLELIPISSDDQGNGWRGKVPRDGNINRMLQHEVATYKRRLKAYEKALR